MNYLYPKHRKILALVAFMAVVLLAWPLPAGRYCFLCFFMSCYALLARK